MQPATGHTKPAIEIKKSKFDSTWTIARKKFFKRKLAVIGLCYMIFIIVLSFIGPLFLTNHDITRVDLANINLEPSSEHWLGTDRNGRDVFTRLIHGGQVSLQIGLTATVVASIIGTTIGLVAGYYGKFVDNVLMRLTEFVQIMPFMVFIIVLNVVLIGLVGGGIGIWGLIIVFSVMSWTGMARIVRSKVLSEKETEYILAAESIGTRSSSIIFRHLFPNVMTVAIVQATLLLAVLIVAESGLSFLGVGVPMEIPSWGNMLIEARQTDVLQNRPWIWMPAAVLISLTILSINFVGEGIKDAFDPKTN